MRHDFALSYGTKSLRFTLPETFTVLGEILPKRKNRLTNLRISLVEALRHPGCSPPLAEIIKQRSTIRNPKSEIGTIRNPKSRVPTKWVRNPSVAIIVSDITRKSKSEIFIPLLLDELNRIGIRDEDAFIVFATGTHRAQTKEEHRRLMGEAYDRVRAYDHDCRGEVVYLGITSRGTRVSLNRRVVEADRIILTGVISYHYYAGFTGGRKSLLPGVAGISTIQDNHRLALNPEEGKNPKAATGILKGNPVHEDMMEAARMLQPDFLLNLILDGDSEVIDIFSGDFIEAHEAGCRAVEAAFGCPISTRADLVIVSTGGYPKDISYFQAHKALDNAFHAVREEGVIILLAECREGIGPPRFLDWLEIGSMERIEDRLRDNFEVVGHNVYANLLKASKVKIILVSEGLSPEISRKMDFIPADNMETALKTASCLLGQSPAVYILPQGSSTFPIF
ncbi:MAG: nickel-dependent lactate racemase [bacterium]|nr:nickel-dependent lactate racemase [bacterium]